MRKLLRDPQFRLVPVGDREQDIVRGAVILAQLPNFRERFSYLPTVTTKKNRRSRINEQQRGEKEKAAKSSQVTQHIVYIQQAKEL